jgi:hypothetical protein
LRRDRFYWGGSEPFQAEAGQIKAETDPICFEFGLNCLGFDLFGLIPSLF